VSLMITVLTFFSKSSLCGVSELDHHKASDIRLPEIFTLWIGRDGWRNSHALTIDFAVLHLLVLPPSF
jgi:hypothetical protein